MGTNTCLLVLACEYGIYMVTNAYMIQSSEFGKWTFCITDINGKEHKIFTGDKSSVLSAIKAVYNSVQKSQQLLYLVVE